MKGFYSFLTPSTASNYGKPQGFKCFLVIPTYIFILIWLLRQISMLHFYASDPDCHKQCFFSTECKIEYTTALIFHWLILLFVTLNTIATS